MVWSQWVSAFEPAIIGDGSAWEILTPYGDPVAVEAVKGFTVSINHNNAI